MELELTHDGIISFLHEEGFPAADAETLGEYLKVPRPTMLTLKRNYVGDARGLLFGVIDSWLNLTQPSREELAKALDKSDYKRIATKIREGQRSTQKPPRIEGKRNLLASRKPPRILVTQKPPRIEADGGGGVDDRLQEEARQITKRAVESAIAKTRQDKGGYDIVKILFVTAVLVGLFAVIGGTFLYIKSSDSTASEVPPIKAPIVPPPRTTPTSKPDESALACTKITSRKDLSNILAKTSNVPLDKMCSDLGILDESCNELDKGHNLRPDTIARRYLEQNPTPCWEKIIRIVCQDFKNPSLAMKWIVKEQAGTMPAYTKYCS